MARYGVQGPNMKYGLRITTAAKGTFDKWYGSDKVKRDEQHNRWVRKGALVVQDIEEAK